jgi:hypothetical protein
VTLYIEDSSDPSSASRIVDALRKVCPDPALTIDWTNPDKRPRSDGKVVYVNQTQLDETCIRVWRLANSPVPIVIRGRPPGVTVYLISEDVMGLTVYTEVKARDQPGFTRFDTPAPGGSVTGMDIIVEPSNDLGRGYWGLDVHDNKIAEPLDAILAHEFGHAEEVLDGIYHTGEDDEHREAGAIAAENVYRRRRRMPERWGHEGGYDLRKELGGSTGGDCFVATAAYGSELENDVQELRAFRDDVLIPTRSGEAFFDEFFAHYYRLSPAVVEMMHADPEVREMVRWALVAPIVGFLRLAKGFPRQDLDELPEPWRGYLASVRDEFERWAGHLPLPARLDEVEPMLAAEELRIALAHLIWRPDAATRYLDGLSAAGELPLRAPEGTLTALADILRGRGLDPRYVQAITGTNGTAP